MIIMAWIPDSMGHHSDNTDLSKLFNTGSMQKERDGSSLVMS
jgi:hypothetical protein